MKPQTMPPGCPQSSRRKPSFINQYCELVDETLPPVKRPRANARGGICAPCIFMCTILTHMAGKCKGPSRFLHPHLCKKFNLSQTVLSMFAFMQPELDLKCNIW
jgi:hypothetical protein